MRKHYPFTDGYQNSLYKSLLPSFFQLIWYHRNNPHYLLFLFVEILTYCYQTSLVYQQVTSLFIQSCTNTESLKQLFSHSQITLTIEDVVFSSVKGGPAIKSGSQRSYARRQKAKVK